LYGDEEKGSKDLDEEKGSKDLKLVACNYTETSFHLLTVSQSWCLRNSLISREMGFSSLVSCSSYEI